MTLDGLNGDYLIAGWWFQPLWKILVNEKDYPIYYGKNIKCSKPPTSDGITGDYLIGVNSD